MSHDALTEAALLGAERAGVSNLWQAIPDQQAADFAAKAISGDESEGLKLLKLAAVAGACRRAAFVPPTVSGLESSAAFHDERPFASHARLSDALDVEHPRLHQEVFLRMQQAGMRIPAGLLRRSLDMGSASTALRPAIIPVLGERGRWLSLRHSSWAWAKSAGDSQSTEEKWRIGSLQERLEALKSFRSEDPAAARERLIAEIGDHAPAERAALIMGLRHGLSLHDEADLVKLLKDRAKEPRKAAAALLSSVPGTAFGKRAEERMAACLSKKGLVSKTWCFEPPQAFDDAWEADGIEKERPRDMSRYGDRAWWLAQIVSVTHPAWFSEHTRLMPDELVKLAVDSEWADALIAGWTSALKLMPTPGWASAILSLVKKSPFDREQMLSMITKQERELSWLAQLQRLEPKSLHVLEDVVNGTPSGQHVSEKLSSTMVDFLLRYGRRGGYSADAWRLSQLLPGFVCILHPDSVGADSQRLIQEGAGTYGRAQEQIVSIAAVRSSFSAWLPILTPTA